MNVIEAIRKTTESIRDWVKRFIADNPPSWNDLKEKPFETIPVVYDITWDGDMTGRTTLDLSTFGGGAGAYFVKVSDKVYTKEEMIGKHTVYMDGTDIEIVETTFADPDPFPGSFGVDRALVVYSASDVNAALGTDNLTNGVYFFTYIEAGLYISALYTPETVKTLDEQFIPDTIARTSDISGGTVKTVNGVEPDENGNIEVQAGVQSDWSQYDEAQPDYVKNRTHYTSPHKFAVQWDGDMTGRVSFDASSLAGEGAYLVKVSDTVYTKEELVGTYLQYSTGAALAIGKITENNIDDSFPGFFALESFLLVVIYSASELESALGAPSGSFENGTYFLSVPASNGYASGIITELEYVKTLDDCYLPDTVMTRPYHLTVDYLSTTIDQWQSTVIADGSIIDNSPEILSSLERGFLKVTVTVLTYVATAIVPMSRCSPSWWMGSCVLYIEGESNPYHTLYVLLHEGYGDFKWKVKPLEVDAA